LGLNKLCGWWPSFLGGFWNEQFMLRAKLSGVLILLCLPSIILILQTGSASPPLIDSPPLSALTTQAAQEFVDGYRYDNLVVSHITSGVVSLVKDGQVLFSKGQVIPMSPPAKLLPFKSF
jgi:CubicO group peptidase (beta-lactamase class C family)